MLKPYSASSFCPTNKNRVGLAHGDGTVLTWKSSIETLNKRATSVAHLTNFSFKFFIKFSQKIPLYAFYTMVQKSQK